MSREIEVTERGTTITHRSPVITGDITERLESFVGAGAAAQRAADKVIHDQIEKKVESKIEAIAEAYPTAFPADFLDAQDRLTIVMALGALMYHALEQKDKDLLKCIDRTGQKFGVSKLDLAELACKSRKKKGSQP